MSPRSEQKGVWRKPNGLTIVEALASLVLLSLIAGVCVPLLEQSLRWMRDDEPLGTHHLDLASFIDEVLADPSAFGVALETVEDMMVARPGNVECPSIQIQRMETATTAAEKGMRVSGHWLRVSCKHAEVYRWVPAEPSSRSANNEG